MAEKMGSDFDRFVPGELVGSSNWLPVTQELMDKFGEATLDPDPMHIDPAWAAENTPYGGTIAFGFFTTSLLTCLIHDALGTSPSREPASDGYFMNYGFDRMRLVSPVPVGGRVRGHFRTLDQRIDEKRRQLVTLGCEIEVEGTATPALVAEWLAIWIPGER